jgi:hypothetical protein
MNGIPEIVTGDNTSIGIVLKINNSTFQIDHSADVRAILVSKDHMTKYMAEPVTLESNSPGADWSNSLVVVEIPGNSTSGIDYNGLALLEIQVSYSGSQDTWFEPVKITKGQIE